MRYDNFRTFKITRNCNEKFDNYNDYKPFLKDDFKGRCAYCNMLDTLISQNFEVDHFIPRSEFKKANKMYLDTDYNNLVYSCPKCNNSKRSLYLGDINDNTYNNDLFYNPVDIDYNDIFYRNEYGGISSDDPLGRKMITNLRLFSSIYFFAYLLERIDTALEYLNDKIENAASQEDRALLQDIYIKLSNYNQRLLKLFNMNYYDSKRSLFYKDE